VYRGSVGREPDPTRVEGLLNEAYARLAGSVVLDVREFLVEKTFVIGKIKDRAQAKLLFRQPSILLVQMSESEGPISAWQPIRAIPFERRPSRGVRTFAGLY
jgi:hypothetical protein